MRKQVQDQTPVDPPNFPQHHFATPSSSGIDPTQVRPHLCMTNIIQRGNFIHCFNGHHGMAIPPGKVLVKDGNGAFTLEDMVVNEVDAKGKIVKQK